MSYVASLCGACRLVSLLTAADAKNGALSCPKCAAAARVIPSCSFGSGDVALFSELSSAVAEGAIAPLEAGRLAIEIERALLAKSYARFFELLSSRLPGLTPIQLVFGSNPHAQHRAFIMLKTILDGLALSTRSGTMTALGVAPIPEPIKKKA